MSDADNFDSDDVLIKSLSQIHRKLIEKMVSKEVEKLRQTLQDEMNKQFWLIMTEMNKSSDPFVNQSELIPLTSEGKDDVVNQIFQMIEDEKEKSKIKQDYKKTSSSKRER